VCWECGLVNCTIQTICKNRTKIISAFEQKGSEIQRFRNPERSDVDETLLNWIKEERSDSAAVSGAVLMLL
jgi:hypothetical protein